MSRAPDVCEGHGGALEGECSPACAAFEPCGARDFFYNDPAQPMTCDRPAGHAGNHADEDYNCEWPNEGARG